MAGILNFCQICQKGIFFTSCFAISFLLTADLSKYLQFPLSTTRNCQKYVNEDVLLEDNCRWKCKFFIFGIFFFSTLDDFSEKTYEKTYGFFLIFGNFNFILTCLQNFLVRKLKTKKCHVFQYVNKTLLILATLNNIFD